MLQCLQDCGGTGAGNIAAELDVALTALKNFTDGDFNEACNDATLVLETATQFLADIGVYNKEFGQVKKDLKRDLSKTKRRIDRTNAEETQDVLKHLTGLKVPALRTVVANYLKDPQLANVVQNAPKAEQGASDGRFAFVSRGIHFAIHDDFEPAVKACVSKLSQDDYKKGSGALVPVHELSKEALVNAIPSCAPEKYCTQQARREYPLPSSNEMNNAAGQSQENP